MGKKGGELWDDSALVHAFDHAVATYKAMHGKNNQAAPLEKEESEDVAAAVAGEEPVSTVAADEHIEKDVSWANLPCDPTETPQQPCAERNTTEQAPLQETNLDKETHVSESKTYSSDITYTERKDSSNKQTWDCNELRSKYFELEEQSRKVLEQLHQTDYWNYPVPGQSSAYQQQRVPAYSATAPGPQSSTTQPSFCSLNVSMEQAPLQETDLDKETHASESKIYSSDVTDTEGKESSNQQTWDYNELLGKYYELVEQSQKVLEQFHQTIELNYQIPRQASAYQQQQVPAYSATAPDPHASTTQPSCCSLNVPMVSVSCCSTGQPSGGSTAVLPSGGCSISLTCDQCPGASTTYPTGATFIQLPTKVSTDNDQVAKAAMMTAEGAMNFMRSTISGDPGSFPRKEAETGKEENPTVGMNQNFDTTGADSDLAVVLNAWYAAGFYTGRYLMQQSMKNSRQG